MVKTYKDIIELVHGPIHAKPLPAIWDFFPCHAGAVGGVPNFLDYYFDVEEKLRLQLKLIDLFPEAVIIPGVFADLGVVVEVSSFGGQIQWFKNGAPFIGASITDLRQIDSLKPPKAGLAGMMPLALTQRRIMADRMTEMNRPIGKFIMSMGPAEMSGLLMGYERYYLGLYDDPARIKKLMGMVTQTIIDWLKVQRASYGGAELLVIADHVCSQVTAPQLEEFILPYMKAIYAEFPEPVKFYHNEGLHSDEHIAIVLRFGANVWHFGSDVHDISDVLLKVGDEIVLFGGVDPHGVMRSGTAEEVAAETRRVVEAARGRRLLLSTGTGTTPEATYENHRAMVEAALA